jgi:hypothetical protein
MQKGRRMPKGTDQRFADFGHFVVTQGYDEIYQRDPRQAVPPDCGFIRFRFPGSGLFTKACQVFVYEVDEQIGAIPKHPEAHLWPSMVQCSFRLVVTTPRERRRAVGSRRARKATYAAL